MLLLNYRIHHARNLLHAPLAAKCPSVTRAGTNKFVKILLANKTRPSSSCRLDENRSKQIRSETIPLRCYRTLKCTLASKCHSFNQSVKFGSCDNKSPSCRGRVEKRESPLFQFPLRHKVELIKWPPRQMTVAKARIFFLSFTHWIGI